MAEIDASEKNEAIMKRLKQLITDNYKEPDVDGKFEDRWAGWEFCYCWRVCLGINDVSEHFKHSLVRKRLKGRWFSPTPPPPPHLRVDLRPFGTPIVTDDVENCRSSACWLLTLQLAGKPTNFIFLAAGEISCVSCWEKGTDIFLSQQYWKTPEIP